MTNNELKDMEQGRIIMVGLIQNVRVWVRSCITKMRHSVERKLTESLTDSRTDSLTDFLIQSLAMTISKCPIRKIGTSNNRE